MISEAHLCAWWAQKQGLDGSLKGASPAEVLARGGWLRSVGGSAPYLALFSRAGLGRQVVDDALAAIAIHELPAARGCTYVVGAADYALALAAGQPFAGDEMKVAGKLGVTAEEIAALRKAVLAALKSGPLAPDELKTKLGDTVRNLGAEGAKKGLNTTLPVALGLLQADGEIRRIPVNGRLDQQRYRYALWQPNPLKGWKRSPAETLTELARRYFTWFGPAPFKGFQEFAGIGVTAAKNAVKDLGLIEIDPACGLLLPENEAPFRNFRAPAKPQYALLCGLDNIKIGRDNLSPMGGSRGSHAIFDRGQLVGRWEFDPATMSIVLVASVKDKALDETVGRTEAFIREELGDVRGFSLDSPKSRVPRIEALRKASAS